MDSCIVVHPQFDYTWPFAADYFHSLWRKQGEVFFLRLDHNDRRRLGEVLPEPSSVKRLVCLDVPVTLACLKTLDNLKEAVFQPGLSSELREYANQAGITQYHQTSEGFWGQSVAEFALALTLCGLRRIPQLHHEILTSHEAWDYSSTEGKPGTRGAQFGDDPRFVNGTVRGKKVRIVGIGNIGSRYASFMNMLGADVAAWDPFANDPCFHRAGARKEWHLDELMKDADIFAPMLPLRESTRGIVTAEHIFTLPKGCLVVLVTRARICDTDAIRKRVLANEIALAADVFDIEPLPLDDPLLGRHNVVHTPHNAGRTEDANRQWAEHLAAQFRPRCSSF
ncbi:hydroxyacid dehydrogenase [Candidatus Poribacteria bacterium]|nr:hydroxyacid dehydrogenase [Candidatus Poribacteria bacterium]